MKEPHVTIKLKMSEAFALYHEVKTPTMLRGNEIVYLMSAHKKIEQALRRTK